MSYQASRRCPDCNEGVTFDMTEDGVRSVERGSCDADCRPDADLVAHFEADLFAEAANDEAEYERDSRNQYLRRREGGLG